MVIATIIRRAAFVSALFVLANLAYAQDFQPLEGPCMGLVLDKTHGVLPVYGVPGAATLGSSVLAARGISSISVSPRGGYALAVSARDQRVILLRNQGTSLDITTLDLSPGASRIVISPSGKAAAVFFGAARGLVVISGLPDSVSIAWRMDLPDFADDLSAFAVSDDGSEVLGVAGKRDAPLFVMGPGLNYRILYQISGSPSFAFMVHSSSAVVVDGALDSVLLVQNTKGDPQISEIAGRGKGISNPVGVAVSADNRQVFVANGNPGGVVSLTLADGATKAFACNCTPTLMEPLGGYDAFRLNDAGQGPVWIFDAGSSSQRIVFVPDQSRRLPVRSEPPTRK